MQCIVLSSLHKVAEMWSGSIYCAGAAPSSRWLHSPELARLDVESKTNSEKQLAQYSARARALFIMLQVFPYAFLFGIPLFMCFAVYSNGCL